MSRSTTAASKERVDPVLDARQALGVYRLMVEARQFDVQLGKVFAEGSLSGWFHSAEGHEATGAAFSMVFLEEDHLIPYHRSRSALFAKGMTPLEVASELMVRASSPSRGRGGDGHIIHPGRRIYGMTGVLGAGAAIAAGVAYGAKMRGSGEVVVHGFGEGTSNRGVVQEGLNMAAIWDLPVVFVCENNLYAEFTPIRDVLRADNVSDRASGLGIPSAIVDGNDPEAILPALRTAVDRAREGKGPTLLEAKTYRLKGHYEGDPQTYREREEITAWSERDPLVRFRERLIGDGRSSEEQIADLEAEVTSAIGVAIEEALAGHPPTEAEIMSDVYSTEVTGG